MFHATWWSLLRQKKSRGLFCVRRGQLLRRRRVSASNLAASSRTAGVVSEIFDGLSREEKADVPEVLFRF